MTQDTASEDTILVVDDEPMVVRAVSQILRRAGYRVITADGPIEASERVDTHETSIRLLLTDVVMPNGGGGLLAERLTALVPGLRVLFMSGFFSPEHDSLRGERRPLTPLLLKPFTATKLQTAVRDALGA